MISKLSRLALEPLLLQLKALFSGTEGTGHEADQLHQFRAVIENGKKAGEV